MANTKGSDFTQATTVLSTDRLRGIRGYGGTPSNAIWSIKNAHKKVEVAVTQSATPTINTDNGEIFTILNLAQAITDMTSGLSGSPVNYEMIMIVYTDNGTARAIARGAKFLSTTAATMATTTIVNKKLVEIYMYNSTLAAWECQYSSSST